MTLQQEKEVADDNSSITVDDFVQLDQRIQSNDAPPNPLHLSQLTITDANDMTEIKLKVASLEAKSVIQTAQINELKEANSTLKQQNAQMANNQLESQIHLLQQKMVNLEKEMATLKEQQKQQGMQQSYKLDYIIYAIKVDDTKGSRWEGSLDYTQMTPHGLGINLEWVVVFAGEAFSISGKLTCGTIVNYFEITRTLSLTDSLFRVGFATGPFPDGSLALLDSCSNFAAIQEKHFSSKGHYFEWFSGKFSQEWNRDGDSVVVGCGIFLNSKKELVIFFTANGTLLDKQIPFKRHQQQAEDDVLLYPTTTSGDVHLETNFSIGYTKPFKYDIEKCPGLDLN